jgi:uncharacterized membrane protein YkvA (DUF1232 family)
MVLIAVALYVLAVVALIASGRRVVARELAALVPNLAMLCRDLARDPRVPRSATVVLVLAAAWVASPIDLLPEFLPVIGPLDDALIVALALRYLVKRADIPIVEEHWRGDPATIRAILRAARIT